VARAKLSWSSLVFFLPLLRAFFSRAFYAAAYCAVLVLVLSGCDSDVAGPNRAPVAVVGPDAEAALGTSVTLDGSASYDPDGDALSYTWQVLSRPANSTAQPADSGSRQTSMQVDVSGIYLVALVVSDGQADSGRDVMQIRAAGCESDAECEDELFCTVDHRCEGGMCLSDAMDCADAGDDCNEGICDEDENACGQQAFSDGTVCEDDGLFCTGAETCLAGVCTSAGNPCDSPEFCDDTADTCSGCGDGEVNGMEQCDPGPLQNDNCCDATTCTWIALGEVDPQAVCDGAPECQVDVCDGSGGCTTVAMGDGAACGDATDRPCDDSDTCLAGQCEANLAGLGTLCRDASGVCDAAEFCDGVMVDCPEDIPAVDGTICDSDGFFCTGIETCQLGVCESPGNPCAISADCDEENNMCGDCGDGIVGTDEVCDPGPPQNDNCCNVADCLWTGSGEVDPQGSCSGAPDCRVDVCDGGGGCIEAFAGVDTNCGDAATECSGQDTCDAVGGCLPNDFDNTTTCDDAGTDCVNQDYCDGSGTCIDNGWVVLGSDCGDAPTECSGQDTCDGIGGCLPNHFDSTTNCGDDEAECVNQDTCDGSGTCSDNGWVVLGADCGDAPTACSGQDTCDGIGGCLPNHFDNTTNCGDDEAECVNQDTCDASGGCTDNGYWAPGTPCVGDAYACTDDTCQGGVCISVANDGNCTSPDICVPVCSLNASGCVTPPGSLALGCEDPVFLDVDTVSDCSITLAGGDITGQEACLSCSASVGVTTLIMTDFEDDLNPGSCAPVVDQVADGWTIVSGTGCYGDGASCPMSDPNNRDCCDNLICPIDLAGTIAFQADRDTCTLGDRQWRLQHTFDTTGLANLELCFDYADRQAGGGNDVLQVDIGDSTGNYQAAVFCDVDGPRAALEDVWFRTCVDLSVAAPFVDDNQAVTVAFFVNSNDNNNRIYIDNISLRGETTACPAARVGIFTEDFSGCSDPLVSWNGWTVGGGALISCGTSFDCFDGSERAWMKNTGAAAGELYRFLDMFAYTDLELCFYYGEDGANGGEILTVDVDSGSGWQPVWSKEGAFGPNKTCAQLCLNLSDLVPAADHNANLGIRFQMQAGDKEINLDQITLTAHQDCSAPALVSLSNPQDPESNGSYDFTATDSDGHLSADITCQWDPDATLSDWSHVWYRPAGINPTNVDPGLLCINPNSLNITAPVVIDTDAGTITGVGPADVRFFVVPQGGGASDLGVFAFDNIDIAADVSVNGSRALVLLACNDLTVSADISATGTDGVMNSNGTCLSGTGGTGGSDGGSCDPAESGLGLGGGGAGGDAGCNSYIDSGGAGGSFGGTGGAGGDGDDSAGCSIAGPTGAAPYADDTLSPLFGGSGGGAGGDDTGGPGGGGGGAVQLSAGGEIHIVSTARILVSGGAGAGGHDGGDSSPGGGGGSGGAVLLEAFSVTVDGVLAANGGGGGAGYHEDTSWGADFAEAGESGTFDNTRAAGGQGSGIGGSGGEGSGGAFGDGGSGEANENGGGGGGAAGRIRINTFFGSATVSGSITPDSSTGTYTQGTIVTW